MKKERTADLKEIGFSIDGKNYVYKGFIPTRYFWFGGLDYNNIHTADDIFADKQFGFGIKQLSITRKRTKGIAGIMATILIGVHPNADSWSKEIHIEDLWKFVSNQDFKDFLSQEWPPRKGPSVYCLEMIIKSVHYVNMERSWMRSQYGNQIRKALDHHRAQPRTHHKTETSATSTSSVHDNKQIHSPNQQMANSPPSLHNIKAGPCPAPMADPKINAFNCEKFISNKNIHQLIIDSNVWMSDEYNVLFNALFSILHHAKKQITLDGIQYDEIFNLKRKYAYETRQGKGARLALNRIERFQGAGFLPIGNVSTTPHPGAFADPRILEMIKITAHNQQSTILITDDKDLRIRATAVGKEFACIIEGKTFNRLCQDFCRYHRI
ncbi:MAG: hypothetical protein A2283_03045 [Lentisphaerae bacterium RIFOXYA12_FULL_48_11]|nr:MAG: hypothetical protein A2283_03045 [Lentisphaerae bacterium RIFOXYA12_FULL_48_11]